MASRRVLSLLLLLLLGVLLFGARVAAAADVDGDGIADELEAELLAKYRPYYRFTRDHGRDEHFLPTDVLWYLRRSEVLVSGDESSAVLVSNAELAADPGRVLEPRHCFAEKYCKGGSWYHHCGWRLGQKEATREECREAASLLQYKGFSGRYINPNNGARSGSGWTDGLYGHVARTQDSPVEYSVEYWQFFAYNGVEAFADIGDHEGDWCLLKVTVDSSLNAKLYQYYHHGDHTDVLPNQVSLYQGTHPVVFVEYGGHEFWPSAEGYAFGAPKHTGDAQRVLTQAPPNLGEVGAPMSPTAAIILHYNGKWGAFSRKNSPPMGPAMHKAWNWRHSMQYRPADEVLE